MIKRITYLIAFSLLIAACGKSGNLKKPSDVTFRMDINKTPAVSNQLTFQDGHFIMRVFSFDGKRDKGDDVSFSREYSSGLVIAFDLNQTLTDLQFEIAQGVYNSIELSFSTFEGGSSPCIVINGTYTYTAGGNVPMRFEFDDSEEFTIEAEADDGASIVLDKDVASYAKIVLDPNHWFQPIPVSNFESATLTDIDGTMTMLINKNKNEDLFDLILDRIDESTEAVFDY